MWILFWLYLGAWQIAAHLSLPIGRIFIPKIFEKAELSPRHDGKNF
jgi:hypothetical protein